MARAARAIIIEDGKILVMYRNKYGSEYYTLVGGRVNEGETIEQALEREVKEETRLQITKYRLVFTENYPAPYNDQYVFLCNVAPHSEVKLQEFSEENKLNKLHANIHKPLWANISSFAKLQFRTPILQKAILDSLEHGFPDSAVKL